MFVDNSIMRHRRYSTFKVWLGIITAAWLSYGFQFGLTKTRTTRMPAFWGYPRHLMITHTIESCWIPSQTRSNNLEDIGQGQRSSYATHLLMLVIICTKYGKNPSGTADPTEQTRLSRPRPNDLEDIGQGQRSLYATHPLILVIICAKYGKNPSRTVDFFFQGRGRKD